MYMLRWFLTQVILTQFYLKLYLAFLKTHITDIVLNAYFREKIQE